MDNIEKQLQEFTDGVDEIMSSTAAVKGQKFAAAVAVNFEAIQLTELLGILASTAKNAQPESSAMIDHISRSAVHIISSMAAEGMCHLTEAEFNEATQLSETLQKRRELAIRRINKVD